MFRLVLEAIAWRRGRRRVPVCLSGLGIAAERGCRQSSIFFRCYGLQESIYLELRMSKYNIYIYTYTHTQISNVCIYNI